MKIFKTFLIIILTFFNIKCLCGSEVENDIDQLKSFLKKLQKEQNFLIKKFIDEKQVSIRDLLNTLDGPIDLSKITDKNDYELSHSINIVLSCKNSKITYHYITFFDKWFNQCKTDIENTSYDVC